MSEGNGGWPFPGDSPVVRARKMALAYRALAEGFSVRQVEELDDRFLTWGEQWHLPQPIVYSEGDWVHVTEAARLIHVNPHTLSTLRVRGRIKGRICRGKRRGFEYLYEDLMKLSTQLRGRGGKAWRNPKSTDRVHE